MSDKMTITVDGVELEALTPQYGTGLWTVETGDGVVLEPTLPQTVVDGLSDGENILRWTITNGACPELMDEVTITVIPFAIPTGFSPNGDGINDFLVIPGLEEYAPAELLIFNRWGEQIFSASDYQSDWDGRDPNGFDLPDDTYFYILRAADMTKNGFFVIKRE